MIYGYIDETGHSSDESQHFNGMAGFLAHETKWQRLEEKWKATLRLFAIPCFHMKDFAHFRGHFDGWNEAKRQRLLARLLTHLESIQPIPIGVIFDMKEFRNLPPEKSKHLTDPYILSVASMLSLTRGMLEAIGLKGQATMIFSDQVEFRQSAFDHYEYAKRRDPLVSKFIGPLEFSDMRDVIPLQAADLLAYELYKECDRRLYKMNRPPRHGFNVVTRMSKRIGWQEPGFKFITKWDLLEFIDASDRLNRREDYWRKRRARRKDSENDSPLATD